MQSSPNHHSPKNSVSNDCLFAEGQEAGFSLKTADQLQILVSTPKMQRFEP